MKRFFLLSIVTLASFSLMGCQLFQPQQPESSVPKGASESSTATVNIRDDQNATSAATLTIEEAEPKAATATGTLEITETEE